MAINEYVTQTYPVPCAGRNVFGDKVLNELINVEVEIRQKIGSNMISSIIECKYNTGAHGQRCKACQPDINIIGAGVMCPYSFDIPYALETKKIKPSSNI